MDCWFSIGLSASQPNREANGKVFSAAGLRSRTQDKRGLRSRINRNVDRLSEDFKLGLSPLETA